MEVSMRVNARLLLSSILFLFLSISTQAAPQNSFDGHYVVPEQNLSLLPKELKPTPILSENGLHLVKMNERQVKTLSHLVHEKKFTCGGFMAVDEDLKTLSPRALLTELNSQPTVRQEKVSPRFESAVQFALSKTVKERFESTLRNLSSFTDRYANGETGVKAAEWLRDEMLKVAKDTGHTNVTAEMIATPRYMQPSVVIKIAGQDSKLPSVLIGGHMDTYKNNKPGSDDDGSGTVTVMEVFKALMESKMKFKRDAYFAFYAAEEWGLHGSAEVVRQFKARQIQMRGVMQFDMTGFKSPKDSSPLYLIADNTTASVTDFTKQLLVKYLGMKNAAVTNCGYACSDHASWFRAGYPVAFPFESSMENYNKTIHSGSDVTNILDMDHAMQFVKLGAAFVVEMAEPMGKEKF
jgi:bacterial leucyl aminopeptidase